MISAPRASPTPIAAGRLRPARDGFAGVGFGAVGFGVSVGAVAVSAAGAQSGSVMRKPAAARSSVDARLSRSRLWRPAPGLVETQNETDVGIEILVGLDSAMSAGAPGLAQVSPRRAARGHIGTLLGATSDARSLKPREARLP